MVPSYLIVDGPFFKLPFWGFPPLDKSTWLQRVQVTLSCTAEAPETGLAGSGKICPTEDGRDLGARWTDGMKSLKAERTPQ